MDWVLLRRDFERNGQLRFDLPLDFINGRESALLFPRKYQLSVQDNIKDSTVRRFQSHNELLVQRHPILRQELIYQFDSTGLVTTRLAVCYLKIYHVLHLPVVSHQGDLNLVSWSVVRFPPTSNMTLLDQAEPSRGNQVVVRIRCQCSSQASA